MAAATAVDMERVDTADTAVDMERVDTVDTVVDMERVATEVGTVVDTAVDTRVVITELNKSFQHIDGGFVRDIGSELIQIKYAAIHFLDVAASTQKSQSCILAQQEVYVGYWIVLSNLFWTATL